MLWNWNNFILELLINLFNIYYSPNIIPYYFKHGPILPLLPPQTNPNFTSQTYTYTYTYTYTQIYIHIHTHTHTMDDDEGGLSFDFEGGLDSRPTQPTASVPVIHQPDPNSIAVASAANHTTNFVPPPDVSDQTAPGNFSGRRSYRQTVCRHWLRSLCMKGEACGFLHQYDKSRMPICRFFRLYGECREQDCVYKHTNEDIKECNMYVYIFCFLFCLIMYWKCL